MKKTVFLCVFYLLGCATSNGLVHVPVSGQPTFELLITDHSLTKNQAQIKITVPAGTKKFIAPKWYGGAPMFLKFVTDLSAKDADGKEFAVKTNGNVVEVEADGRASYTISYIYNIPQKVSGEVDLSLPVLNNKYGRFDNNLTFLMPDGLADTNAQLTVKAPRGWRVSTSWSNSEHAQISKVSQLISGMIVLGGYDFSEKMVGETKVRFALRGDFSHNIIKEQFEKILASQQEIVGSHPAKQMLVVFQPTVSKSAKGTSLTNALVVNVPDETKLEPFNFQVMGTVSHELFHQWNAHHLSPAEEKGVYLFSEGFTNYFAIAALVRAKLIPQQSFGRFLCRYRLFLEGNSRYPGANFKMLQEGQEDSNLFEMNYQKGPLIAVLLDLALRDDSGGRQSVASWFRALDIKFAGTKGYRADDLIEMALVLSEKKNGKVARVFKESFFGGDKLPLDQMQKRLGTKCRKGGECTLLPLEERDNTTRQKVFSAG